jgi:proton glutamate symport protein
MIPSTDTTAPPAPARRRRFPYLTTQIFVALFLGIAVGEFFPGFGVAIKPLADMFLRMIKMIIGPLLFSTLVVGIAGTGDTKAMGRIAGKALLFFYAMTTLALFLGLGLVIWFQPGAGVKVTAATTAEVAAMATKTQSAWGLLINLFPTSLFDALARNEILQVVVYSIFFGIALAALGKRGKPVTDFLDATAHVMFKFTNYVMLFAPIGVFAAISSTVGSKGLAIFIPLGKVVILMYVGLAAFILVAFWTMCIVIRVPFGAFLRMSREPTMIAFTTASSEAALPRALEVSEQFGAPKSIVGLVLPTGYSFNLTGTTLYLSLCTIFVAQLFNVPLTFGQQIVIMLTLMLTSKGVAGVPRAAIVVLTATLTSFNLPLEGAAILLGIDQVMDMGRTAVNVMGNCLASAVVARWEGVFDDAKMRAFGEGKAVSV